MWDGAGIWKTAETTRISPADRAVKWAYKAAWLWGVGRARGTFSRARSSHELSSNAVSSDREDTRGRAGPNAKAPGFRSGQHTAQCVREVEFNGGVA